MDFFQSFSALVILAMVAVKALYLLEMPLGLVKIILSFLSSFLVSA
jgi:hypothetical protein